ncbi:phage portal protein, partial [Bacillus cereus]
RKNSKRFLLKGDFLRAQDEETKTKIDEFFDNQLKNWLDPNKETSTFQLPDGYNLEDLSDGGKGSASNVTSRDTSSLI